MEVPESLRGVGQCRTISFIRGEPLVHFLVLAASVRRLRSDRFTSPDGAGSRRVTVTAGDLQHLREGFAAQWRRAPTQEELQHDGGAMYNIATGAVEFLA